MEKILILVSNKNNQFLLEKELSKRYIPVSPDKNLKEVEFDLIIIDGVELKKRQSEIKEFKNKSFPLFLPVILLTTKEELGLADKFLFETVDELIIMPIEKLELRARLEVLLRARYLTYILERETVIDPLTGIYNRRFFYETAKKEFAHFQRYGRKFSIIFIDIDDFKKINDKYGHISGDIVLQNLAQKLKSLLRKSDYICRYGGEEFVVILPGVDGKKALSTAERMRQELEKEEIKIHDRKKISVTISCGISTTDNTTKDIQDMINKADIAMYKAKQSSKNKVYL